MKKCEYNPYREIVQFNNLIVDSSDFLSVGEFSSDTKTPDHEYSFGHGSYVDLKRKQQFVSAQEFDSTLHIYYKNYPLDQRVYLKDYIKKQLIEFGRIWAIEDNKLLWAYAYVTNVSEAYESFKGYLSINVSFFIPEGVWHIADSRRTFIKEYDSCDIFACEDYRDVYEDCDCCVDCRTKSHDNCENCLCDCFEESDAICNQKDFIHRFKNCGKSLKITYDCTQAEKLFGDKSWGQKICKQDICFSTVAGRFYSPTLLDTSGIVMIEGSYNDPIVTINDISITIKGTYDGVLKIDPNGDVWYRSDTCCDFELIDMENVIFKDGKLAFQIHQGMNRLIVENSCCNSACAYVRADNIVY